MKMLGRSPAAPVVSRDALLFAALLFALLAGVAAARTLLVAPPRPLAPLMAPVATSVPIAPLGTSAPIAPIAPIAPTVGATTAPLLLPNTIQTSAPGLVGPTSQTSAPAAESSRPAPATALPVASVIPRATVPVAPKTTAAPSNDVHAIAPELDMPGFSPPPGGE